MSSPRRGWPDGYFQSMRVDIEGAKRQIASSGSLKADRLRVGSPTVPSRWTRNGVSAKDEPRGTLHIGLLASVGHHGSKRPDRWLAVEKWQSRRGHQAASWGTRKEAAWPACGQCCRTKSLIWQGCLCGGCIMTSCRCEMPVLCAAVVWMHAHALALRRASVRAETCSSGVAEAGDYQSEYFGGCFRGETPESQV